MRITLAVLQKNGEEQHLPFPMDNSTESNLSPPVIAGTKWIVLSAGTDSDKPPVKSFVDLMCYR
jgi:hypothetical protein